MQKYSKKYHQCNVRTVRFFLDSKQLEISSKYSESQATDFRNIDVMS